MRRKFHFIPAPDDRDPAPGAAAETLGGGGGDTPPPPPAGPEWLSSLSDEALRANATLQRFGSPEDLAKSYLEVRKTVGENGALRPPAEGDNPAEWDGWYQLGAAKSAEDLKIERPEMPDGVQYDEAREAAFIERAIAGRYPAHIVQDIVNLAAEESAAEAQALADHRAEQRRQLDQAMATEWGSGPEREEHLDYARRAARKFGIDVDAQNTIEELAGSFNLMSTLSEIGRVVAEHKLDGGASGDRMSPEAAQDRLDEINRQLRDNNGKISDALKRERDALYRQIHNIRG